MEIRIRDTGAVVTEYEFRAMFPNTSFAAVLSADIIDALGGDVVLNGPQPTTTRYQTAYRDGVEQIAGKWYTKYSIVDMDADAIAALDATQSKSVRDTRNQKLKDSDWTQLVDAPLTQTQSFEWQTYRQALRDISTQTGFPWEVMWPQQPE